MAFGINADTAVFGRVQAGACAIGLEIIGELLEFSVDVIAIEQIADLTGRDPFGFFFVVGSFLLAKKSQFFLIAELLAAFDGGQR